MELKLHASLHLYDMVLSQKQYVNCLLSCKPWYSGWHNAEHTNNATTVRAELLSFQHSTHQLNAITSAILHASQALTFTYYMNKNIPAKPITLDVTENSQNTFPWIMLNTHYKENVFQIKVLNKQWHLCHVPVCLMINNFSAKWWSMIFISYKSRWCT